MSNGAHLGLFNVSPQLTARTSHARGHLKDTVRAHVATMYGLSRDLGEDQQAANRAKYVRLLDKGSSEPDPGLYYKVDRPLHW